MIDWTQPELRRIDIVHLSSFRIGGSATDDVAAFVLVDCELLALARLEFIGYLRRGQPAWSRNPGCAGIQCPQAKRARQRDPTGEAGGNDNKDRDCENGQLPGSMKHKGRTTSGFTNGGLDLTRRQTKRERR